MENQSEYSPPNFESLQSTQAEMIHDISYNWHGNRFATSSSDKTVNVYSLNAHTGQWQKTGDFQAHDGPVWKVAFGDPQIGNFIATCGLDREVKIFEEQQQVNPYKMIEEPRWNCKYHYKEIKEEVRDIKFGPKVRELQGAVTLAIAAMDGKVRLIEARNYMNLQQWDQSKFGTIQVSDQLGVNCISWNKAYYDPPMIAVGLRRRVFQLPEQEINRINSLPGMRSGTGQTIQANGFSGVVGAQRTIVGENSALRTATAASAQAAQQQSTQAGVQKRHKNVAFFAIYMNTEEGWHPIYEDNEIICDEVHDVSWSNQGGKNFHQIAICGKFGLKLLHFTFNKQGGANQKGSVENVQYINSAEEEPQVEGSGNAQVYHCVSWNVMGTILATTDDRNTVSIWDCRKRQMKLVQRLSKEFDGHFNTNQFSQMTLATTERSVSPPNGTSSSGNITSQQNKTSFRQNRQGVVQQQQQQQQNHQQHQQQHQQQQQYFQMNDHEEQKYE